VRNLAAIYTVCLLVVICGAARADDAGAGGRFDGVWETNISCPNASGALGFAYQFASTVKDGVLHGEKGSKGEPGWLTIDGKIGKDGASSIYADGLVGASQFAVGQRPVGSSYGYHIDAKFSGTAGTGTRVEGRPCKVTFTKKQ
jgi:hypothetical protein